MPTSRQRLLLMGKKPTGWLPSSISGLQAWYDFSDKSTLFTDSLLSVGVQNDGDEIGAVKDKSLLGHNAIQATATKLPLYKTGIKNGKSIARFDGSNDFLQTAAFTNNQPQQVFAVVINRGLAGAGEQTIIDGRTKLKMRFLWGYSFVAAYAGTDLVPSTTKIVPAIGECWLSTILFSGVSSSHAKNQGIVYTGDMGLGTGGATGVTLGSLGDGTGNSQQDTCEVLIYNTALSASDVIAIENYLNTKWSIFAIGSGVFTYNSSITTA